MDLSPNTALRTLHIRNVDASSADCLVLLLDRRIYPTNLVSLMLDLHITTQCAVDSLAAPCSEVSRILSRTIYSSLESVTVWLREIPPSSCTRALLSVVEGWMPELRSLSILHVKPWWNLNFHAPSPPTSSTNNVDSLSFSIPQSQE